MLEKTGIANTTETGTEAEPAEIEVTPEMIEEAVEIIRDYVGSEVGPMFEPGKMAAEIYRAMARCRPRPS